MSTEPSSEPAPSTQYARATYDIDVIKAHVKEHKGACFTASAQDGVWEMGLGMEQAIECICAISGPAYKTMPVNAAHLAHLGLWQDVYHVVTPVGLAYVKFTYDSANYHVVISFKEL